MDHTYDLGVAIVPIQYLEWHTAKWLILIVYQQQNISLLCNFSLALVFKVKGLVAIFWNAIFFFIITFHMPVQTAQKCCGFPLL